MFDRWVAGAFFRQQWLDLANSNKIEIIQCTYVDR